MLLVLAIVALGAMPWAGEGLGVARAVLGVDTPRAPIYVVLRGNTHSHTTYTSSHGETPPDNGPPREHHARAKVAGFDFYVTTDHTQEVAFEPTHAANAAWVDSKRAAAEATDATFVGLAGYEHSENNGGARPGGGHLNVINSDAYLDALEPGVDIPALYRWLGAAAPNGSGAPIVASFNHAGPGSYNGFDYRTAAAADVITMLELVNGAKGTYEDAYRAANNAGWKVAPTCGIDNHSFWGITHIGPCVGVLATGRTKAEIIDAMRQRRTFAARDRNMTLTYTANAQIMGSTLAKPPTVTFVVTALDPDVGDPEDRITALEVVDGSNAVVAATAVAAHSTVWTSPPIPVAGRPYLYVRARNAGSGGSPMAWAAPIWTGA